MFAGQVIVGACVSLTVTVKEQVAELLAASVARKVTDVLPKAKNEPEAAPRFSIVSEVLQSSVAVALLNATFAPH